MSSFVLSWVAERKRERKIYDMYTYLPLPERQPVRIHRRPLSRSTRDIVVALHAQVFSSLGFQLIRVGRDGRLGIVHEPVPVDIDLELAVLAATVHGIGVVVGLVLLRHTVGITTRIGGVFLLSLVSRTGPPGIDAEGDVRPRLMLGRGAN